jgi:HPt (histidine-containing phosphotransfer) domain-containing protein
MSDPQGGVSSTSSGTPDPAGQGQSSPARIWAEFHGVIFERLTAVETAVDALRRVTLTPEVRQTAVLEAHRLAGSLGMFGLEEGTRVARQIEHLFAEQVVLAPDTLPRLTELSAVLRRELEKGPA